MYCLSQIITIFQLEPVPACWQIEEECNGTFLLSYFSVFADQLPVDAELKVTWMQHENPL